MKMLNAEITSLLDRLYNLRGDNSVVIVSMEKEREKAVATREKTSALKAELQSKITELDQEERVLAEEGEKLKSALATIRKDEFSTVIARLNIDFDPFAIKEKIEKSLPITIEKVASEKQKSGEELVKVEEEMNDAITKIEELGIRKDEAIANQNRLNKYFELALSGNINLTRDEITALLAQFNFSDEEQREAAKLLMFPEDGLFDYEKSINDIGTAGKSISEVIQEAKEVQPIIEIEPFTPITNAPVSVEPIVEDTVPSETIKKENKTVSTKEELIEVLTQLGFDYLDFTSNDFEKLLTNYNDEVIKLNVKCAKNHSINLDIFVDNIELFYDPEFQNKIEKLTNIGKMPQDIYLNPNVLVKYNLDELNIAIETLHSSGLDPKSVPLIAY